MKQKWTMIVIAAIILGGSAFTGPASAVAAYAHADHLYDSPSWNCGALLFYTRTPISEMPPHPAKYRYDFSSALITFGSYEQNPGPRVYYRCAIINLGADPFEYPWETRDEQGDNLLYHDIQHSSADSFNLTQPTDPGTNPGSYEAPQTDNVIWKLQTGLDPDELEGNQDPLDGS